MRPSLLTTGLREKMLLTIPLILCFTRLGSSEIRTGFASNRNEFSGVVVTKNILSVAEIIGSGLQCVMLCLEMQACVSVFYREVSNTCQFHDVLFLSPQDGEEEIGTKYYSLATGSCPSGYIHARVLNLCYRHEINAVLYNEVITDCESRGEHLIVIDSQEKQDHFKKQITSSSDAVSKSYFVDGSDAQTEGVWLLHDGRPMTFSAWKDNSPGGNDPDRDYVIATKGLGFLWNDGYATYPKYYMCERDL